MASKQDHVYLLVSLQAKGKQGFEPPPCKAAPNIAPVKLKSLALLPKKCTQIDPKKGAQEICSIKRTAACCL
jgi:hypothetical protein